MAAKKIERRGTGLCRDPFRDSLPGFEPYLEEIPPLDPLRRFVR